MELVQARIVTDDVAGLAAFYARLAGVPVTLNEYYVEVPTGQMSAGFSRRRFTEYQEDRAAGAAAPGGRMSSSSTSPPATWTPSTRGSPRWTSTGSCRRPPSPGATAA